MNVLKPSCEYWWHMLRAHYINDSVRYPEKVSIEVATNSELVCLCEGELIRIVRPPSKYVPVKKKPYEKYANYHPRLILDTGLNNLEELDSI